MCSQKCVNSEGSYTCKCDARFYVREPDGKTCKRSADIQPWLVFTNKYYIRNMTTDASEMRIMHQGCSSIHLEMQGCHLTAKIPDRGYRLIIKKPWFNRLKRFTVRSTK